MIEGIPDGWEPVRVGAPNVGEFYLSRDRSVCKCAREPGGSGWLIIRKIEKPKQYRPFANAAEYIAKRREVFVAVDWNLVDSSPGFFAVVSANGAFVWVAFGDAIKRFEWSEAFEKLKFRHVDNSTSPFGIEVTE